ncbi:MAG: hypothetical protein ABJC10_06650 [Acidobacteriota bacterium]
MRNIPPVLLLLLQLSVPALSQQPGNPKPQTTPVPTEPQPSRSTDDDVVRITTNLVQELRTQLRLFRDGQLVFTGKENSSAPATQPDPKRITITGAVKLGADLVPGEYVLQVTAIDPLADEKDRVATQWIDIEIIK